MLAGICQCNLCHSMVPKQTFPGDSVGQRNMHGVARADWSSMPTKGCQPCQSVVICKGYSGCDKGESWQWFLQCCRNVYPIHALYWFFVCFFFGGHREILPLLCLSFAVSLQKQRLAFDMFVLYVQLLVYKSASVQQAAPHQILVFGLDSGQIECCMLHQTLTKPQPEEQERMLRALKLPHA